MFSIVLGTYDVIIFKIQTWRFYLFACSLIFRWYMISENFIFLASVEHTQKIGGHVVPTSPPHVWSCSKSPMWGRVNLPHSALFSNLSQSAFLSNLRNSQICINFISALFLFSLRSTIFCFMLNTCLDLPHSQICLILPRFQICLKVHQFQICFILKSASICLIFKSASFLHFY